MSDEYPKEKQAGRDEDIAVPDAGEQERPDGACARRLRDNLYDRINVSVGTMNIAIIVICVILAACLIVGILLPRIT